MITTPKTDFPRVSLPGVDEDEVSFVQAVLGEGEAAHRHVREQQKGLVRAMLRLGKPVARQPKKPARETANVRHMRRMRERALAARFGGAS